MLSKYKTIASSFYFALIIYSGRGGGGVNKSVTKLVTAYQYRTDDHKT